MTKALTGAAALLTAAGSAFAFTFPTIPSISTDPIDAIFDVNLGDAPAGSWTSVTVTAEFDGQLSGAWSNEAFIGFGSAAQTVPAPPGYEYTDGFGFSSPDGASFDVGPTNLTWNIFLDPATPFAGGAANNLWLNGFSSFGYAFDLNNVSVTLGTDTIPAYEPGPAIAAPEAIDLGVLGNETLTVSIDTLASDFDTELGLYDQAGNLIVSNDDDPVSGSLQSALTAFDYPAQFSGLNAGTYYIAVGGFNTTFDPTGFSVIGGTSSGTIGGQANGVAFSGQIGAGDVQWYSFTVLPTPGAAALLGIAGLAGVRRRR